MGWPLNVTFPEYRYPLEPPQPSARQHVRANSPTRAARAGLWRNIRNLPQTMSERKTRPCPKGGVRGPAEQPLRELGRFLPVGARGRDEDVQVDARADVTNAAVAQREV